MPIIKNLKQHKLLLDTHVWLWIMIGNSDLTANFRKAFAHSQKNQGVLISPISIWEIGMLVEKNRIQIDMDVQEWVDQALDIPGVKLSPITSRIAIQSSRLPGIVHGDPADRLLIATAHEENAVLTTCDEKLLKYGADKFVNVHDPSKNFLP
ncbi:MAG TPA: type II toxin-antitoxin system VapC family toxin [Rhabdochlamydiaceae bacterium]|nr:type II toxin-antitoxin system VapC family toxin [Rhabdochlamydiaceae bacterium]